jgi:hypothetical protein
MAIAALEEWLNGDQDYSTGVDLLEELNPKHPKLFILKKFGAIPAHRSWLKEALIEVKSEQDSATQKKPRKPKQEESKFTGKWFHPEKLSEDLLEEYYNRIRPLFNHRQKVHGLFDPKKPQEHNAQVSKQLREISKQLDIYFERAKKFIETGEEESRGLFARYKSQERLVQAHREYIARRRKKPHLADRVAERMEQLETDLQTLQKLEERLYELT